MGENGSFRSTKCVAGPDDRETQLYGERMRRTSCGPLNRFYYVLFALLKSIANDVDRTSNNRRELCKSRQNDTHSFAWHELKRSKTVTLVCENCACRNDEFVMRAGLVPALRLVDGV